MGADHSIGEVLAFLDAHCELGPGWLEPYLQRIKQDYKHVVVPMHDMIDVENFKIYGATILTTGSDFEWHLKHSWKGLSEEDQVALSDNQANFLPVATMPGCCFGIHRKWWEELGKYDPGFEVWGMENLKISLKSWM